MVVKHVLPLYLYFLSIKTISESISVVSLSPFVCARLCIYKSQLRQTRATTNKEKANVVLSEYESEQQKTHESIPRGSSAADDCVALEFYQEETL